MKVVAIVNGRARKKGRVIADLKKIRNHDVQILVTKKADDTITFTEKAIEFQADLLIIGGGDGTVNKVVNTIMEKDASFKPAIAIQSCGSANDFTRTLNQGSIAQIIKKLESNETVNVDLTVVKAKSQTRYAVNMATCGISGNVIRSVEKMPRWIPNSIRFFNTTVRWLAIYKPAKVRLKVTNMTVDIPMYLGCFGSGKYVGNGFGLCPQAELNSGKFAVTALGVARVKDFIFNLSALKKAKRIDEDPRIVYTTSSDTTLHVLDRKMPIESDGEYFLTLQKGESAQITCISGGLKMIASSN